MVKVQNRSEGDRNSQDSGSYEVGYKKPPKSRQFGEKDGNQRGHGYFTKERSLRYRLQQIAKMTEIELRELLENPESGEYEKNIARTLLEVSKMEAEKRWRVLEGLTNQDSGYPKQQVEQKNIELKPILPKPKRKRKE